MVRYRFFLYQTDHIGMLVYRHIGIYDPKEIYRGGAYEFDNLNKQYYNVKKEK